MNKKAFSHKIRAAFCLMNATRSVLWIKAAKRETCVKVILALVKIVVTNLGLWAQK